MIVTEEHLDAAVEDRETSGGICQNCILAKAFDKYVVLGVRYMTSLDDGNQVFDDNGQNLANLFDFRDYDEIRKLLPIEVNYEK